MVRFHIDIEIWIHHIVTEPKGLVRNQFKQSTLNSDLMSDRNPGALRSSTRSNEISLFHDQIITDRFYPIDGASDLVCFVDRGLRINKTAQLNDTFAGLYADLK